MFGGANDHTGNTTVNAGTLHLAENGQLKFTLGATNGSCNVLSGNGSVMLDGAFVIDTTAAAALSSGTWPLESVTALTGPYGNAFRVVYSGGAPWTDAGNDGWTKDAENGRIWTFTETTGMLTLGAAPSPYEAWVAGSVEFTQTDPSLDPYHDGMANPLEKATRDRLFTLFGPFPTLARAISSRGALKPTSTLLSTFNSRPVSVGPANRIHSCLEDGLGAYR